MTNSEILFQELIDYVKILTKSDPAALALLKDNDDLYLSNRYELDTAKRWFETALKKNDFRWID